MRIAIGHLEVLLEDRHDVVVNYHRDGRAYEPESLAAWLKICRAGRPVLDVGAYTGVYSIVAAKCGCAVTTLEPFPIALERLEGNLQANGVAVDLIRAAASDRAGTATIWHNPNSPLTTGASLSPPKTEGREPVTVETLRIDDLDLPRLAGVKIDVERHEAQALRGARETIRRDRPEIVAEALEPDLLADTLAELPGYRVIRRMDSRNVLLAPS